MLEPVARFVVKRRGLVIGAVIILTLIALIGVSRLQIESDILQYLPKDNPAVRLFSEIGEKFKGNYLMMVALRSDDLLSYQTLKKVQELTEAYQKLDGVADVVSLTDALDIKKTEEGLELGRLLPGGRIPEDPAELGRLKEYVMSKESYRGVIVSEDGRYTTIVCRVSELSDKSEVSKAVRAETERLKGDYPVYYAGAPLQMVFVEEMVKKELWKLIPLTVAVLMVVLFLGFGSIRGAVLPLLTVGVATGWVMGLAGFWGRPLTIVSDVIPVILLAVGSAYGIHLLDRYYENVRAEKDRITGISTTISTVGLPIVMAGVTTLVGFLSLLTSDIVIVRDFGLFTGIGVLFAFLLALFFLPSILAYLRPGKRDSKEGGPGPHGLMDRLADFVLAHKKFLVGGFGLIAIVSILGIPRISREVNLVEYLKSTHPLRVSEEMMEEKFGGSVPIQIRLEASDVKQPAVLSAMRYTEAEIEALPEVAHPQSVADLICEMNWVLNGYYAVPATREEVANLWILLEGQPLMGTLVASDQEALIQAKLATVRTSVGREAIAGIDRILAALPDSFVVFNEPGPELVDSVNGYKAMRATRLIGLVARKRGQEIPEGEIEREISNFLKEPALDSAGAIADLRRSLLDYFYGDEADVVIESRAVVARVTDALVNLAIRSRPSRDAIKGVLCQQLPESIIAEDPEGVDYASESIARISEEVERRWSQRALLEKIAPWLPGDLLKEEGFLRDVAGQLFEATGSHGFLPYRVYASVMGEADPDLEVVELELSQTGLPVIYRELDDRLIKNMIRSILIAFFLISGLMALEFRSVLIGGIATLPVVFMLLVNFGLMGWFKIPLDMVTTGFAAVGIGIGIDYAIHILSRFKQEFRKNPDPKIALEKTMETTGKAVFINAASVAAGFLVLLCSSIVPIQRFGCLLAVTMLTSALAAVALLPSALLLIRKEV